MSSLTSLSVFFEFDETVFSLSALMQVDRGCVIGYFMVWICWAISCMRMRLSGNLLLLVLLVYWMLHGLDMLGNYLSLDEAIM